MCLNFENEDDETSNLRRNGAMTHKYNIFLSNSFNKSGLTLNQALLSLVNVAMLKHSDMYIHMDHCTMHVRSIVVVISISGILLVTVTYFNPCAFARVPQP